MQDMLPSGGGLSLANSHFPDNLSRKNVFPFYPLVPDIFLNELLKDGDVGHRSEQTNTSPDFHRVVPENLIDRMGAVENSLAYLNQMIPQCGMTDIFKGLPAAVDAIEQGRCTVGPLDTL